MSTTPVAAPLPPVPASAAELVAARQSSAEPAAPPRADEVAFLQPAGGRFLAFNAVPSWLVSAIVHFVAILILALTTISPHSGGHLVQLDASASDERVENLAEQVPIQPQLPPPRPDDVQVITPEFSELIAAQEPTSAPLVEDAPAMPLELPSISEQAAPKRALLATIGSGEAALSARGAETQGAMIARYGGTPASQEAVALALAWLAGHQNSDGSWSFDHRTGPCNRQCPDPGHYAECKTGATAMALLPFLGAGQTHFQGAYKTNVERGLYYLKDRMRIKRVRGQRVGDLTQGIANDRAYAHGLAAIALCEAYAMTQDKVLQNPAQLSLNYIAYAQDPVGGGWRYEPHQRGDTSVLGWQLMALKSGHMAYLRVDPDTIKGASRFLDGVQANGGANYGYTGPGVAEGTTAIGLLSRMYLGWKRDEPALVRGVQFLSAQGPSKDNLYYDYYATQVLRHFGGEPESDGHALWVQWNTEMRDWLVASQSREGHTAGSWMMRGDRFSNAGGRLYCTAMAAMILEVYYRHMPLYGKQATTEDFPL